MGVFFFLVRTTIKHEGNSGCVSSIQNVKNSDCSAYERRAFDRSVSSTTNLFSLRSIVLSTNKHGPDYHPAPSCDRFGGIMSSTESRTHAAPVNDPDSSTEWLVVLAGFCMFSMSFAIGANDCANSFASAFGSGALSFRQCVLLASVAEFAGAFLLSQPVVARLQQELLFDCLGGGGPFATSGLSSEGPRSSSARSFYYRDIQIGMVAVLVSATCWLLLSSFFGVPVSTTHSTVGGIVAVVVILDGVVAWSDLGLIVASWVTSPVLGLICAAGFLEVIRRGVFLDKFSSAHSSSTTVTRTSSGLDQFANENMQHNGDYAGRGNKTTPEKPKTFARKSGARALTCAQKLAVFMLIIVTVFVLVVFAMFKVSGLDIPVHFALLSAMALAVCSGVAVLLLFRKWELAEQAARRRRLEMVILRDVVVAPSGQSGLQGGVGVSIRQRHDRRTAAVDPASLSNREKLEYLFGRLCALVAAFQALAHGANDIANAVAPFGIVLALQRLEEKKTVVGAGTSVPASEEVPPWVFGVAGLGVALGLATCGARVMRTVGQKLVSDLRPSQAFSAELAATLVILGASRMGLPISTTHVSVGSVLGTGRWKDEDSGGASSGAVGGGQDAAKAEWSAPDVVGAARTTKDKIVREIELSRNKLGTPGTRTGGGKSGVDKDQQHQHIIKSRKGGGVEMDYTAAADSVARKRQWRRLLSEIALSWILTLPAVGLSTCGAYYTLQACVRWSE